MTHNELTERWKQQNTRFGEWQQLVYSGIISLKDNVTATLQVGEGEWYDISEKRRRKYVEAERISKTDRMRIFDSYKDVRGTGEVPFNVVVAFDYAPETPKRDLIDSKVYLRIKMGNRFTCL